MKKILNLLIKYSEEDYKIFNSSLIPNVDKNSFLGVRIPNIRKIAKQLSLDEKNLFLSEIHHEYFEENILHAILINEISDFDKCICELDKFLPYVNNWSVCDTLKCDVLCFDMNRFYKYIVSCIKSNYVYKVRFAFVMMLKHFIKSDYFFKCNELALNYNFDDYYINMSIAWYFSYALIYKYNETIYIFEKKLLSKFIHNKSISKACDSYRLSNNIKDYLRSLRIK
jgi:3-methyladenine DNA glycosylase AlkD